MHRTRPTAHIFFVRFLFFISLLSFQCARDTSESIASDARLQLVDFFDKQNKLFDRQKRYEFQDIVHIKRLDRHTAEVIVAYRFIDKYLTAERTAETRQSTFLLRWQDEGRLVVPPESKAIRVHWALTSTWEYDREKRQSP